MFIAVLCCSLSLQRFLLLILVAQQLARGFLAAVLERCLLFLALQPRATAIFAAVAFAAMSGSY